MDRRQFLSLSTIGLSACLSPKIAFAQTNYNQRLIFIIARGAYDGLNIIIPNGDINYEKLRGDFAIKNGLNLDGFFSLNPNLINIYEAWKANQAGFYHAIASPYRERSHFDAQNILEGGFNRPYSEESGWLNRFLGLLNDDNGAAVSFTSYMPTLLRGANRATTYTPSLIANSNDDLLTRAQELYANDMKLSTAWGMAMANSKFGAANLNDPIQLGRLAGEFLSQETGPRIAMIETNGWDTHQNQTFRLNKQLSDLDKLIGAIKNSLGVNWKNSIIIVASEFGRTASFNGTGGTDHGTANCAMVIGGLVKKSAITTDWPSLAPNKLHEGRDLAPTSELFGLFAGVLGQTYGIDPQLIAQKVFPNASPKKILMY